MGTLGTRLSASYHALARRDLPICVGAYLALAAVFGYLLRDTITPDGVVYSRLAGYLARGDFELGIVSFWSPLLPWTMAPLVAVGVDPLHAGRIVLALAGALHVLAVGLLLRRRTDLPATWRLPVLALTALGAVAWTTWKLRPDALLAAGLLFAVLALISPRVLDSRRLPLAAGIAAGLAALGKSYGLPFALVWVPLTLGLQAWPRRREPGIRRALARAVLFALLGVSIATLPWATTLSLKYGRPLWTSAAAVAHAAVGPTAGRPHPVYEPRRPPPGRLYAREVPEVLDYAFWSPFDGRRELMHQLEVIRRNGVEVLATFRGFDALGLAVAGLLLLPAVSRRRQRWPEVLWVWATVAIFAGGFLPVYFAGYYITSFLWPFCAVYLFVFLRRALEGRRAGWVAGLCLLLATLSLAWAPVEQLRRSLAREAGVEYKAFGRRLAEKGARGPVAVASTRIFGDGVYVAYLLDAPYFQLIEEPTVAATEETLTRWGVGTYLVDSRSPLAAELQSRSRWRLIDSARRRRGRLLAFAAPGAPVAADRQPPNGPTP